MIRTSVMKCRDEKAVNTCTSNFLFRDVHTRYTSVSLRQRGMPANHGIFLVDNYLFGLHSPISQEHFVNLTKKEKIHNNIIATKNNIIILRGVL